MKLSKVTRWALVVGIFAILLVTGGVNYARQQAEQRELSSAIARANQDYLKYSAQKKELETRLSQANTYLASAQDEFRQYSDSLEIDEALFETAKKAGVTIVKLTSSAPGTEVRGGISFRVFSFSITAEGEVLPALLLFCQKLSETFATGSIASVRMQGGGGEQKWQVALTLKVYAYGE